jgi:SAM-dependent methyltransferase
MAGLVRRENYQHDETFTREGMSRRTAASTARFLLPFLKPGVRIIDCGCGQGTVTLDFAAIVAPGEAIGFDVRETDLEAARTRAVERGLSNVKFENASLYEIPFPDASFDVAFAHQVLHHLGDPLSALREMRRVLKPGGIAGIADHAWDVVIRGPINPALEQWDEIRIKTIEAIGGTPGFSRNQRAAMREAGFARTDGHVMYSGRADVQTEPRAGGGRGSGGSPRSMGGMNPNLAYLRSVARPIIAERGWATPSEVDAIEKALEEDPGNPESFFLLPVCWAVGWAD